MSAGTAYAKRYAGGFVNLPSQTTGIDQTFLNTVEAALLQLIGAAPTVDGQVAQWDNVNTRYGPALLLNKNIDAAAAIAKSKLDFTGANAIGNADIAGAAAIARSKLDFGSGLVNADISTSAAIAASKIAITRSLYSGGPPGTPADGDIWAAVDSLTVPTFVWYFRFANGATTYKWEFIGGSDAIVSVATAETTAATTFVALATAGPSFTLSRGGDYDIELQCDSAGTAGTGAAMGYDVAGTGATYAKSAKAILGTNTTVGSIEDTLQATFRETAVAAATAIVSKYRAHSSGAFTNSFGNRFLRIRPVRII